MNIKELIGLVYGVFMGTSTIYVKAPRSFEFPVQRKQIGNIEFLLGGKRNSFSSLGDRPQNSQVEKMGNFEVTYLPEAKVLAVGDLFYNQVHPPLKEIGLPSVHVLREILEGLKEKYQPQMYLPAEGDIANSYEEFLNYLSDLSDKSLEYDALREKYAHFKEIVGFSSFTENFDYLRKI